MPKTLEVIVMSAAEATLAAQGGADRLELVSDLETGGLTPEYDTVRATLTAVSIPVRVMLRENSSMSLADNRELAALQQTAARLQQLSLDGLVMGWVTSDGIIDTAALEAVLSRVPLCNVTFHRAFEHLTDPIKGIGVLKTFKQVDKILTGGGSGTWSERKRRLRDWSQAAAPEISILVGGGLSQSEVADLMADSQFPEIHVGRAARTPSENNGALDAVKIALLKSA
jgi:copper homeostasis protein